MRRRTLEISYIVWRNTSQIAYRGRRNYLVALDEALGLVAKYVTNREQARKLMDAMRAISG